MKPPTLLVIDGHPDEGSLGRALADAYCEGARGAGVVVERLNLRDLSFDLVLRAGYRREQRLEPDLVRAKALIEQAAHVAWVFPMWWATAPALVWGFVDRVMLPGWAFAYEKGNSMPRRLLAGRSASVLVTMDSPWWWYALAYKRAVHGAFSNGTLTFCGFAPVRTRTVHKVREMDARAIATLLDSVRADGARDGGAAYARRPRAPSLEAQTQG